jgi:hypothetical protein
VSRDIFGESAYLQRLYGGILTRLSLYTQLDISSTGPIAQSRLARDLNFQESGGRVDVHSITADEVLEQANRIFAPYKLKFAAPLSWFAVWKSGSLCLYKKFTY